MNSSPNLNNFQTVFLDDTALAAYMNPDNPHYIRARSLFLDLDDQERHLVTSNYIIFDTHERLRNEYSYTIAQFFLNTIDKANSQDKLTIISGHPDIEKEAKQLLIDRPQYQFSLSEAVTTVVMLTYQIKRIFTFNINYSLLPRIDSSIKVIPSVAPIGNNTFA